MKLLDDFYDWTRSCSAGNKRKPAQMPPGHPGLSDDAPPLSALEASARHTAEDEQAVRLG